MSPDYRVIELPEDDPTAIQVMVYWMYHDEICVPPAVVNYEAQGNTEEDAMKDIEGLFVHLYVIGQKYQIEELRNDSIDAFLGLRQGRYLLFGVIPYVYHNTPDGSPLRGALVKAARSEMWTQELDSLKGVLCSEFLFDVTRLFFSDRDGLTTYKDEEICKNFHVHAAATTKYAKSRRRLHTLLKKTSSC